METFQSLSIDEKLRWMTAGAFIQNLIQTGSFEVCHGTLRNEDLLPEFAKILKAVDLNNEHSAMLKRSHLVNPQSEEAYELIDEMIDALTSLAPPGFYFGSNEGDFSSFGFWRYH